MQKRFEWNTALALLAGVILAVMIDWNSLLARHSSPLIGAWLVHGTGLFVAAVLVAARTVRTASTPASPSPAGRPALWTYLGGIPGALCVLIAAWTVNGPLGLTGTLALMLLGQMLFSVAVDAFGLFAMIRRKLGWSDYAALALVSGGGMVVIMARA